MAMICNLVNWEGTNKWLFYWSLIIVHIRKLMNGKLIQKASQKEDGNMLT